MPRFSSSFSNQLALNPENLISHFGEDGFAARNAVKSLFAALTASKSPKVSSLYSQWFLQFSEVCGPEEKAEKRIAALAKRLGIDGARTRPFPFFFCLHTYYASLVKLLALRIAQYYLPPKPGSDIKEAAALSSSDLNAYLSKIEEGESFKELGIGNFLDGDLFGWYLDEWNGDLYRSFRRIITIIADYSVCNLGAGPGSTRDLLKRLYQHLVPRVLRHRLGEYYTPDWLAERLLNMLEGGEIEVDPDKRFLDPTCGSGTFLVLVITKMQECSRTGTLPESEILKKVLSNVVGFDLNPLAVTSARMNYLLALGHLLEHKEGEINIPVYLCDSILAPHEWGPGAAVNGTGDLKTALGSFSVPKSFVNAKYINIFSNFLEEAIELGLDREEFMEKLYQIMPLDRSRGESELDLAYRLYMKLADLEGRGVSHVWSQIIKNAVAPAFAGRFDYIVGNPPWVNWESLPERYKSEMKPLWLKYGLFPHGGMDTILGKAKKDVSMMMTYVAMDKYLKPGGKLGFLITQSVFKTAGSAQGFRRFLLEDGRKARVIHVDDMVDLKPFEGAANRTSILILGEGEPTRYPVQSYICWKKKAKEKSIPIDVTLEEALDMTQRRRFAAEPVSGEDPTSPWITGRTRSLEAIRGLLGRSHYVAHAGISSGGLNAVYWVEDTGRKRDGAVVVSNITGGARKRVESVVAAIEPDLLYPLLRGRDVGRWKAEPRAWIIMTQDPAKRRGLDEERMKSNYPRTYDYLKRFEKALRERAAFKRYFARKNRDGRTVETGSFYSMFDVGDYTFAPYKVVWTRIARIEAAVVSTKGDKPVIPQETLSMIGLDSDGEAFYLAGMINSIIFQFAAISYSQAGGKSMGSPHVVKYIKIPCFMPGDELHLKLAALSWEAHEAARSGAGRVVQDIEKGIDGLSARIWRVSPEGLREIKRSLKELSP